MPPRSNIAKANLAKANLPNANTNTNTPNTNMSFFEKPIIDEEEDESFEIEKNENTFESIETNSKDDFKVKSVIIAMKRQGKRTETYIIGWTADDELKEKTLRHFKQSYGCNGKLKKIIQYNGEDVEVIMIQGNHKEDVFSYMKSIGVLNLVKDTVLG